jgi:hypothetical protein
MQDISFRWWLVLMLCVVFGALGVRVFKFSHGFPFNIPLQMLALGICLSAAGLVIGYWVREPLENVLSLKTTNTGSVDDSVNLWSGSMMFGYALLIDGAIGCVTSAICAALRGKRDS